MPSVALSSRSTSTLRWLASVRLDGRREGRFGVPSPATSRATSAPPASASTSSSSGPDRHARGRQDPSRFDRLACLWGEQAPLGWNTGDPSPVADAVCFLLSDLSRGMAGEIVHVDGGFHAMGAHRPQRPGGLVAVAPILPSRDLAATATFYSSLGFEQADLWPDEYHVMRDEIQAPLLPLPRPRPRELGPRVLPVRPRRRCRLRRVSRLGQVGGIPRLHGAPQDTDYGLREFAVVDIDGNLLRIGSFLASTG